MLTMKQKYFSISISLLSAICIIIFFPFVRNSNLIKEILWWILFPFILGIFFAVIRNGQGIQLIKDFRITLSEYRNLFILLLTYFIWNIYQTVISIDKIEGLIYLLRLSGFIIMFLSIGIIFKKRYSSVVFSRFISYTSLIASVYVFFEFFGYDFIKWSDMRRPPGTFGNPNFTADFLSAVIPLIFCYEFFLRIRIKSLHIDYLQLFSILDTFSISKNIKSNSISQLPIISLLSLIALLTTQSRSGALGLFVGIFSLCICLYLVLKNAPDNISKKTVINISANHKAESKTKNTEKNKTVKFPIYLYPIRILLTGILLITLFIGIIFWAAPDKLTHVASSSTVQLRILIWKGSMQLWNEKFFGGWGLGSFNLASQKIRYLTEPIAGAKVMGHAHNWFIESLVEHGIIGTGIFIAFLFSLFGIFFKNLKNNRDFAKKFFLTGIISGMLSLLFSNLVDVWFNWWDGSWLFWLLAAAGLSVCVPQKTVTDQKNSQNQPDKNLIRKKVLYLKFTGIIFIILSGIISFCFIKIYKSERAVFYANNYLNASRYEEALNYLNSVDENFPPGSMIKFYKAFCFMQTKKLDEGKKYAEKLIKEMPFKAAHYLFMGQIYATQSNVKNAEPYFIKAYEIEPSGENSITLAKVYLNQKKAEEAIKLLQNQLSKAVYPPLLKFYLKVENDLRGTPQAREFITKLRNEQHYSFILKDSAKSELARWEGELSFLLKDYGRAIYAYQIALLLNSSNFQLWNDFGLILKQIGFLERAFEAFVKSEILAPDNYAPAFNRLELAIIMNDYKTAEEMSEKLEKLEMPEQGKTRLKIVRETILPQMKKSNPL